MKRKGVLYVVSGASGSGKTSLCKKLVRWDENIELSISFTTRKPRTGERDGRDYNFVTDAAFDRLQKRRDLAEWAVVHGNRYGTSMSFLRKRLNAGKDVVCDIDYQGGFALQKKFGSRAVLVFVLPPSLAELRRRLKGRGTDHPSVIAGRLSAAKRENKQGLKYDYLILNDDLKTAIATLKAIVIAERARTERVRPSIPARLLARKKS